VVLIFDNLDIICLAVDWLGFISFEGFGYYGSQSPFPP
jgi:hypothetical protein